MRFSPRLDFVASTRQKAFSQLKELGVAYYDVFGRSGVSTPSSALSNRLEILKEIIVVTEKTLMLGEPCIMFFDNNSIAEEYQKTMGQCFDVRQVDGKYIQAVAAEFIRRKM